MVPLSPWFRAPEWRSLRLASCIATGLSTFAPIGHAWYLWGSAHLVDIGVPYYLLEGAFLLVGCYIYQVGTLPPRPKCIRLYLRNECPSRCIPAGSISGATRIPCGMSLWSCPLSLILGVYGVHETSINGIRANWGS